MEANLLAYILPGYDYSAYTSMETSICFHEIYNNAQYPLEPRTSSYTCTRHSYSTSIAPYIGYFDDIVSSMFCFSKTGRRTSAFTDTFVML